jgi:hypothetical protein
MSELSEKLPPAYIPYNEHRIILANELAKQRSLIREEVEKVKRESPKPGWIPHEHWYEACDRILELLK